MNVLTQYGENEGKGKRLTGNGGRGGRGGGTGGKEREPNAKMHKKTKNCSTKRNRDLVKTTN
jgi:hypothetical protein